MIANESFLSVASSQIAAPNIYNIYFRLQSYRKSASSSIKFVSYNNKNRSRYQKIAQNEHFITIKSNYPKLFYDEIFRNIVFHL